MWQQQFGIDARGVVSVIRKRRPLNTESQYSLGESQYSHGESQYSHEESQYSHEESQYSRSESQYSQSQYSQVFIILFSNKL